MKFFLAIAALVAVASANPLNTWTLDELTEAVNNPHTNPALLPYLQYALNKLVVSIHNGVSVDAIVVPTPAVFEENAGPSAWTLQDLSEALQNPHTNPAHVPYLESALNDLMSAIFSGQTVNTIVINLPAENIEAVPIPLPEFPDFITIPEIPVSSPLVQVIVNVNGQQTHFTEVPHDIVPTPVQVVDETPEVLPTFRQ